MPFYGAIFNNRIQYYVTCYEYMSLWYIYHCLPKEHKTTTFIKMHTALKTFLIIYLNFDLDYIEVAFIISELFIHNIS